MTKTTRSTRSFTSVFSLNRLSVNTRHTLRKTAGRASQHFSQGLRKGPLVLTVQACRVLRTVQNLRREVTRTSFHLCLPEERKFFLCCHNYTLDPHSFDRRHTLLCLPQVTGKLFNLCNLKSIQSPPGIGQLKTQLRSICLCSKDKPG
jgi:hypothetical protein